MLIEIRDLSRVLVLKCDRCKTIFEKMYETKRASSERHFCSMKCVYEGRIPSPLHGRKTTRPCSWCGSSVTRMASFMEGKQHVLCDRECYAEWKKVYQHPNAIEALKRTVADPEFRAFMSERAKERFAHDGHPWVGRHHSEETKAQLRISSEGKHDGALNGMYKRSHTETSCAKMSEAHSKNLVEGRGFIYGTTGHTSGWHTSSKGNAGVKMFYRSSWERDTMLHFDADDDVVSYGYETIRIPYYDTGNKKRHYVPDFLVTYFDGHRSLIEIKPKQFLDNEKTKLKAEAARAYCEVNSIETYEILTGELLRERGIII